MILLIIDDNDFSSYKIIKWLKYFGSEFIVLNNKHKIKDVNVEMDKTSFKISNHEFSIDVESIKSVFYRRGHLSTSFIDKKLNPIISKHLLKEIDTLFDFFIFLLKSKNSIGNYYPNDNKLIMLEVAKLCNLKIPSTIITTSQKKLQNFFGINKGNIITKAINNGFTKTTLKDGIASTFLNLTNRVFFNEISQMDNHYFPSLFQKNVRKKIEIRTFFLRGEFYSMAIFSQDNQKTAVDFRNYDNDNQNRIIPFNLPSEIEKKLKCFMNRMSLDTGSIDLIYSYDKEYILLEVNPEGQFDTLEEACNYNICELIAKELINE